MAGDTSGRWSGASPPTTWRVRRALGVSSGCSWPSRVRVARCAAVGAHLEELAVDVVLCKHPALERVARVPAHAAQFRRVDKTEPAPAPRVDVHGHAVAPASCDGRAQRRRAPHGDVGLEDHLEHAHRSVCVTGRGAVLEQRDGLPFAFDVPLFVSGYCARESPCAFVLHRPPRRPRRGARRGGGQQAAQAVGVEPHRP